MELSCFGIEFETCVSQSIETYCKQLQQINDQQGLGATFKYSPDPLYTDYGVWMVTIDRSIRCGLSDSVFIKSNSYVSRDDECIFYGVELVSPKTNYTKEGYSAFNRVVEQVVLNPHFSYDINKSQGMHINVSHPDQDKLKMLKAWWYFEPMILTLVPPERRHSKYAVPLRERFKTIEELESTWEEFFADAEEPPAKYTALCVKPNRFEIRIIPATMNVSHITAWLTFSVRFMFSSIVKNVNFDFASIPTIAELFEFIDVDPVNPIKDLIYYFYSSETFKHSYRIVELIKSGDEESFKKYASRSPDGMLKLLIACVPVIPSLNLLKFLHILLDEYYDKLNLPDYIEIPENTRYSISTIFTENGTSLSRAYNPVFYKEYIQFVDYDLAREVIKTAIQHRDCETVIAVSQIEEAEIDWYDILGFDSEWLVDCYENPLPPDDVSIVKSWRIVKKLIERYPEIQLSSFPETWIETDELAQEQFQLLSTMPNADYSGFKRYIHNRVCEGSTDLITLLLSLINSLKESEVPTYINTIFLCENPLVNSFLDIYLISDNSQLATSIIKTLAGMEKLNMKISSELLKNCLRSVPREDIIEMNLGSNLVDTLLSM